MNETHAIDLRRLLFAAVLPFVLSPNVAAQAGPDTPEAQRYELKEDDTLQKVGESKFGRKDLAPLLQGKNPMLDVRRLAVGTAIALPTGREAADWDAKRAVDSAVAALASAKLVEESEGDLRRAAEVYALVAALDDVEASVRDEATLRLARIALRTGDRARAESMLRAMGEAGGERAERARSVLQQEPQGQADIAKALVERARAMLLEKVQVIGIGKWDSYAAPFVNDWGRLEQDIAWLGEPAARALVAVLAEERARNADPMVVRGLSNLLLRAGSPAAVEFYTAAAREADPHWRLLVLGEGTTERPPAADLRPALLGLLKAPDPEGKIVERMQQIVVEVSKVELLQLANDPAPAARIFAFWAISRAAAKATGRVQSGGTDGAFTASDYEAMLIAVRASLDDGNPAVVRTAYMALGSMVGVSNAAAELFVRRIPRVKQGGLAVWSVLPMVVDDALVASIAESAKAMGRVTPEASKAAGPQTDPRYVLARMLECERQEWTNASVDAVLEIAGLGYFATANLERILAQFRKVATDAQWTRLLQMAPDLGEAWLRGVLLRKGFQQPAAAVPTLQALFERFSKDPAPATWGERMVVEAGKNGERKYTWIGDSLLRSIGASGDGGHTSWLVEQARSQRELAEPALDALVALHERGPEPGVRDAIRDLMQSDLLAGTADNSHMAALAILVRAGHADAPAVFAKVLQCNKEDETWPWSTVIAALRTAGADGRSLWPQFLQQWPRLFHALGSRDSFAVVPVEALPSVLRHLAKESEVQLARQAWESLLESDVRERPEVREAMRLAVRNSDFLNCRDYVLTGRGPADRDLRWLAVYESDLRESMPSAEYLTSQMKALLVAGLALSESEWKFGLEHTDADVRVSVIRLLPSGIDQGLRELLFARLADSDGGVRFAAVEALASVVPLDVLVQEGVARLVPLMRDPSGEVKEAATKVLDDLRAYQERRAFWDRFQNGVQTGPEATVSKLLLQAKAGQPKAQRLLAIDGLSATGMVDALPYLIEMAGEADAEIANAARSAIGTLRELVAQRALQPK